MFKAHWAHFNYTVRHKWHVFWACLKMGVPIHRAILHDLSKFSPAEWKGYVINFFNRDGTRKQVRDKSGAYDPNEQPIEFKKAWMHHQRNKHHWQGWISVGDRGTLSVIPIPVTYLREMIADWIGAGIAHAGIDNPRKWYDINKDKMIMDVASMIALMELMDEYFPKEEQ